MPWRGSQQIAATPDAAADCGMSEEHATLWRHVAGMPLGVVEWDGDGRVVGYSPRAEALFGFAPEEVLGKRIDELPWVPEEDRPPAHALAGEPWSSGQPTSVTANRNLRKDGTALHCEWYSSAVHDASGKLVSVLSFVLDVTSRHRAEAALRASEASARAVMENVRDHVVVLEAVRGAAGEVQDWRYVDANEAALTLLATGRELLGRTMREVLGAERTALRHPAMLRVLETGERERYEAAFAGRSLLVTLFRLGADRVASGSVDITDRQRSEAGLRAANERLRETDRRKDEFLAMLSHELRNPLAPIRNAVAILERATPTGAQAARAKAVIGRQVDHLARLVDDLLDVTRIARGKVELRREPVELGAVVRRAAEDHRPVLYQRGVSLAIELPEVLAWVEGDATRLTQVFGNLLQNAAKFTDHGGRVTVALAIRDGAAEVRVKDTGVGIDGALLDRVFEPFVQSDQSLARTQGGLGLGLALVRGIVTRHGGTAHAESAGPGRGTELVVRLPVLARAGAGEAPAPLARQGAPRRVLVVDDSRDGAESLGEVLRLLGHEVDVAFDGPGAVARARAAPPEIVLCDIGLPGMTGYEVARQLRALLGGGVRIVAVSGYARPEDVERARGAGFDGHLAKPLDPEALVRLVGGANEDGRSAG